MCDPFKVFPTYDLGGNRVTSVHTHYRQLAGICTDEWRTTAYCQPLSDPDRKNLLRSDGSCEPLSRKIEACQGSCDCPSSLQKAKCLAGKYKCLGQSVEVSLWMSIVSLYRNNVQSSTWLHYIGLELPILE